MILLCNVLCNSSKLGNLNADIMTLWKEPMSIETVLFSLLVGISENKKVLPSYRYLAYQLCPKHLKNPDLMSSTEYLYWLIRMRIIIVHVTITWVSITITCCTSIDKTPLNHTIHSTSVTSVRESLTAYFQLDNGSKAILLWQALLTFNSTMFMVKFPYRVQCKEYHCLVLPISIKIHP